MSPPNKFEIDSRQSQRRNRWTLAGFAFSLLFTGSDQIQRCFGNGGVIFYCVLGSVILILIYKYAIPYFLIHVDEEQSLWLAVATFLGLFLIFFLVYPLADSGIVGGGSDNDDLFNLTGRQLLRGRYIYDYQTYLGNPPVSLHHLPGSIVLAVPFVLIGNAAYQNLFWLVVFYLTCQAALKDRRLSLLLLWIVFSLCPTVCQQFVTGSERFASGIYVLSFLFFAMKSLGGKQKRWVRLVDFTLLGIGLSSRPNFLLFLPLLFASLGQTTGWKAAIQYTGLTCTSFLAITLPFLLHPKGIQITLATLRNRDTMIGGIPQFPPQVYLSGLFLAVLLTLGLSLRRADREGIVFLQNCFMVQVFPVVYLVIFSYLNYRDLLWLPGYGSHFIFFAALAAGKAFKGRTGASELCRRNFPLN